MCVYSGILFSHKKEWNNAIFSNMDGFRDYHTKWSKSDSDKYLVIYIYNLKRDINELIYKIEIYSQA